MRKSWLGIAGVLLGCALGMGVAQAELPPGYRVVLLTENFPPFNMAVDDKNFARDDAIDGISTDLVREMFKRAGIDYNLSLRFPWDRSALAHPGGLSADAVDGKLSALQLRRRRQELRP